jgi:L-threonylcarbamoyladenylate synthase
MPISLKELLKKDLWGKVIVFETDTVYGIGCLVDDLKSVQRIYEIKNREFHKPMAILCANTDQVKKLIHHFEQIEPYAQKYWPGALTLICQKRDSVDDLITAGGKTVGIRIPDNPIAQAILTHFGPMVTTSLNQSHEPAILKYQEALTYEKIVDFVVEGKDLSQLSSTVFDPEKGLTLRQGTIVVSQE